VLVQAGPPNTCAGRIWTDEAKRRGQAVVLITHLLLEQARFDVALQLREGVLEPADG